MTVLQRGLILIVFASVSDFGYAQQGPAQSSPNPQNYMPNFYNRQNQPLSPYLNFRRGGDSALNYYYGVRPGLASGGNLGLYGQAGSMFQRQTFFPLVDTIGEGDPVLPSTGMRPSGHPVGFRNTLNYFGGMGQQPRSNQQQQSPAGRGILR